MGMWTTFTIILAVTCASVSAQAKIDPGDIFCRFFSNGAKKCQTNCQSLSNQAMKEIVAARKLTSESNVISEKEIANVNSDPILFVKCSDEPVTRMWNAEQGFAPFASTNPAAKKKLLYTGSCVFRKDAKKSWACRACERPGAGASCFIGGQFAFKDHYPKGWTIKGDDLSTISVAESHD